MRRLSCLSAVDLNESRNLFAIRFVPEPMPLFISFFILFILRLRPDFLAHDLIFKLFFILLPVFFLSFIHFFVVLIFLHVWLLQIDGDKVCGYSQEILQAVRFPKYPSLGVNLNGQ